MKAGPNESWAKNQAALYLDKIETAFKGLLVNPEIGRERPDVKTGYRSLVIEQHIHFYKVAKKEVHILGIVHGRMDIVNYKL